MLDRLPLASLQLAVLGVLVLALSRLPGAWRAWGWRLALVKATVLLIGAVSLPWLASGEPSSANFPFASADRLLRPMPVDRSGLSSPPTPALSEGTAPPSARLPEPIPWLLFGWLGGSAALFARLLLRTRRRPGPLMPVPDHWKLRTATPVWLSPTVPAPMIVGLFRPTVVLPAWPEPPSGWQSALAHELAHARRKDVLWDTLVQAFAALFWFHPFAWLAVREHRLACEEACDAEAIRNAQVSPRDYALTLVHLGRPTPNGLALGAPARALSRRIHAMHRRSLAPRWALPLLALAIFAAIPLELTAAPYAQKEVPVSSFDHMAVGMIGRPSVQKELGLTKEDLKRANDAGMALYPRIREIGNRAAQMKAKNVPLRERLEYEKKAKDRWYADTSAAILAELTPEQVKRLRQIALQRCGPLALKVPEIARISGVSTASLQKIAQLRKEADREMLAHSEARYRNFNAVYKTGFGLTDNERERRRTLEASSMDRAQVDEYMALNAKMLQAIRRSFPDQTQALDRVTWTRYSRLAEAALSPEDHRKWKALLGKPVPPIPGEGHLF
jgi:hypothetical protein